MQNKNEVKEMVNKFLTEANNKLDLLETINSLLIMNDINIKDIYCNPLYKSDLGLDVDTLNMIYLINSNKEKKINLEIMNSIKSVLTDVDFFRFNKFLLIFEYLFQRNNIISHVSEEEFRELVMANQSILNINLFIIHKNVLIDYKKLVIECILERIEKPIFFSISESNNKKDSNLIILVDYDKITQYKFSAFTKYECLEMISLSNKQEIFTEGKFMKNLHLIKNNAECVDRYLLQILEELYEVILEPIYIDNGNDINKKFICECLDVVGYTFTLLSFFLSELDEVNEEPLKIPTFSKNNSKDIEVVYEDEVFRNIFELRRRFSARKWHKTPDVMTRHEYLDLISKSIYNLDNIIVSTLQLIYNVTKHDFKDTIKFMNDYIYDRHEKLLKMSEIYPKDKLYHSKF